MTGLMSRARRFPCADARAVRARELLYSDRLAADELPIRLYAADYQITIQYKAVTSIVVLQE